MLLRLRVQVDGKQVFNSCLLFPIVSVSSLIFVLSTHLHDGLAYYADMLNLRTLHICCGIPPTSSRQRVPYAHFRPAEPPFCHRLYSCSSRHRDRFTGRRCGLKCLAEVSDRPKRAHRSAKTSAALPRISAARRSDGRTRIFCFDI